MKEGDIVRLVRVRFPGQILPGTFQVGHSSIKYGQKVIAMSERGMTVGFINSKIYEAPYSEEMGKLPTIKRVATDDDVIKYKEFYQSQREAGVIFNRLVHKHGLPMKLQKFEFVSCGFKAVFQYTAQERIDFRDLLKDLKNELKRKIELRHIPDNFQHSDIGPCGPDTCLFINSVLANSRRPCSEAYCCLEDNDLFYEEKRSRFPKINALIATHTGEIGKVQRVDFVKEEFEMLTDLGTVKRYVSELYKETLSKKTTDFPKEFETISYDTKVVIGQTERLVKKEREEKLEYKKLLESAKEFAEKTWRHLNA